MAVLDPIQGKKIHGPPSLMPSAGNTNVDYPAWTICPQTIMIWLLFARLLVRALKNSGLLADQTNSLEKNEQNLFQNFNFGFFAMFLTHLETAFLQWRSTTPLNPRALRQFLGPLKVDLADPIGSTDKTLSFDMFVFNFAVWYVMFPVSDLEIDFSWYFGEEELPPRRAGPHQ